MIDQVPGYPRREEVPQAPVSSQAGVASFSECLCGRGYRAFKTRHGRMCAPCANEEDRFSDD